MKKSNYKPNRVDLRKRADDLAKHMSEVMVYSDNNWGIHCALAHILELAERRGFRQGRRRSLNETPENLS